MFKQKFFFNWTHSYVSLQSQQADMPSTNAAPISQNPTHKVSYADIPKWKIPGNKKHVWIWLRQTQAWMLTACDEEEKKISHKFLLLASIQLSLQFYIMFLFYVTDYL